MNRLRVDLESIQHVKSMSLDLDLSSTGLVCLVGRNGAGKTTLVRALRNLSNADTFIRTATPYAFSSKSRITYKSGDTRVTFAYDDKIRSLNCRDSIPPALRQLVEAELPLPYGMRFNYFRSASEADLDIRKAITFGKFSRPDELIDFLTAIYGSDRFSTMVEVRVKGKSYYAIVCENDTYIREDYLSSGEYFLINLYRTIKGSAKLLVIDEIDLSLDAAAQANLAGWLRNFCNLYGCKILFTTHSLALMHRLEPGELFYMDDIDGNVSIAPTSFSFARAKMFGFAGFDRCIVTEDKMLTAFISYLIEERCAPSLLSHKVIYVGSGALVGALVADNERENFLGRRDQVIGIVDGDQKDEKYVQRPGIHLIPLKSIEKDLLAESKLDPEFPFHIPRMTFDKEKSFIRQILKRKIATQKDIFAYLVGKRPEAFQDIATTLQALLPPSHTG
ncbi:AAA family ATPase [Stenotrophomonas geniculata]|uniref:AAA family ATPase n=1 Tax=Stenotrophomonas TaxID=40323 RepID=UPI000C999BE8|nr:MULTISPECIES: AAA family ATPase [Stenotrophomonas]MDY0956302.1 AAA family ATPase [Stenotrophomonas rhizophila]